jgi:hypothetical protein
MLNSWPLLLLHCMAFNKNITVAATYEQVHPKQDAPRTLSFLAV